MGIEIEYFPDMLVRGILSQIKAGHLDAGRLAAGVEAKRVLL